MPTHLLQAALVSSCLCDGKVVGGHLCPTGMGASTAGWELTACSGMLRVHPSRSYLISRGCLLVAE